ncbi:MAG: hypothetical protein NVS4B3_26170 [Gemmatimonadaceae bacterium]
MRGRIVLGARRGIVIAALLGFSAMVRYPGGDPFDRSATRYSLTRNFLSDLGMTVAYNGQSNRVGAALFAISLLLLVASVLIILAGLVGRIATTGLARMYARAAALVGLMTAAAFVAVAVTPENRLLAVHVQATMLAFRLVPVAAGLLAAAAWVGGDLRRRYAAVLSGLTFVLAFYSTFLSWGPSTASLAGLQTNVIAQKVVAVVLVTVLLFLNPGVAQVGDGNASATTLRRSRRNKLVV